MNRNISWVVVLTSILVLLLLSACQPGQTDEDPPRAEEIARRIENVESGLRQAVITEGRDSRFTLAERMAHYNVPGVSIAVINNGRIEWARGYGVLEAGGDEPVTTETMFQAASISKPVAAVGALSLVESGALTLDADVNDYLTSWKVPQSEFTVEQPLTLAHLLSHSGGVTVHGFRGYAHDEQVPTLTQLLDGQAPANSDPIRVDTKPGDLWRYSGGGFCIVQQMMIDASGKPFPELMQEFVLGALGMEHSTYEQPLPERLSASAARGHRPDGQLVPGRWHTYPEMAAAGLWTTPSDLARFAIGLQLALARNSSVPISPSMTALMLQTRIGRYGLGIAVNGEGQWKTFSHGGSNEGYKCFLFAYAHKGMGAVIMTNSDYGYLLYPEILRAIAAEYGWPDYKPEHRAVHELQPEALAGYAGSYELDQFPTIAVSATSGGLIAEVPGQADLILLPESETLFFSPDTGMPVRFEIDESGQVSELVARPGEPNELRWKRAGQ